MDYSPNQLAGMSDKTFYAIEKAHTPCGKPWCAIAREGFNRPRVIQDLPFKAFQVSKTYSNIPHGVSINERTRAI
jgi:hypothetical protein